MPHLYAAASHPMAMQAMDLASEGPKTKGPVAVFGVLLMFGVLCGGVFMLLQSSFGVKVGYLITGTAFFGCWLILAVLWLTGVPGVNIPGVDANSAIPDIDRSTPQFTGPQGSGSSWNVINTDRERREQALPEDDLVAVDIDNLTDQGTVGEITAAQTAAGPAVAEYYAQQTGAEESAISAGTTFVFTDTQIVRKDRRVQWVRLTTGPAELSATVPEETRELISQIRPATFDLYFVPGDLARPTYIALGLFTILFGLHAGLLVYTEVRQTSTPVGAPERLVTV